MDLNIEIQNFKSIRSTRLPLRIGLNILIGPNGSGKTCLLSSLKFLGDVLRFGAAQAFAKSGGAKMVYHRGQKRISFAITHDYGERLFKRKKWPFHVIWEINIAQSGPEKIATIVFESLEIQAYVRGGKHSVLKIKIDRNKHDRVSNKVWLCNIEDIGMDSFRSYWFSVKRKADIRGKILPEIRKWVNRIKKDGDTSILKILERIDFKISELYNKLISLDEYSIVPDVARKSTDQLQFAQMQPDGGGVSEVIHALENKHFHKIAPLKYYSPRVFRHFEPWEYSWGYGSIYKEELWRSRKGRSGREMEKVLENINREMAAAVRPIDRVGVEVEPTTGRRGVVFRAGSEKFYPEEVSDGTMKWLCILVSILVSHSKVYLLEEPENFLHPWMQQRLIRIMREEAHRSGTIFIIASHSSVILNASKPEEVLIVKQSEKGTQLNEISDQKEIEEVLSESDFRLGDLWVSGAIGGMPADE